MDDMVVDMLYVLMDFDLADLMGGIGTEVGLTYNSAHTLGMVKVVYPVEEYISAYKLNFEGIQLLQDLRREKLDILDEIGNIISVDHDVTRELFRNYLIKAGTFNEEQFEDKLKNRNHQQPTARRRPRTTRQRRRDTGQKLASRNHEAPLNHKTHGKNRSQSKIP